MKRIEAGVMARLAAGAMMVAAGLVSAGCTPFQTYPVPQGSFTMGGPVTEPVPAAMAAAIRYEHDWHGKGATPIINLPPGTPPEVYAEVIQRLGQGEPMTDASQRAYTIESVRVRPFTAEVDIIYPYFRGGYQAATVYMDRHTVGGQYEVTGVRQWRLKLEPHKPNYVAPPPKPGVREAQAWPEQAPAAQDQRGAAAPVHAMPEPQMPATGEPEPAREPGAREPDPILVPGAEK